MPAVAAFGVYMGLGTERLQRLLQPLFPLWLHVNILEHAPAQFNSSMHLHSSIPAQPLGQLYYVHSHVYTTYAHIHSTVRAGEAACFADTFSFVVCVRPFRHTARVLDLSTYPCLHSAKGPKKDNVITVPTLLPQVFLLEHVDCAGPLERVGRA